MHCLGDEGDEEDEGDEGDKKGKGVFSPPAPPTPPTPLLNNSLYFFSGCAFSSNEGVPIWLITLMNWYNRPKSL
ncbi:hypothetical protein SAMD00079811_15500 [Scytonema sp. HK-05]|nr:hypothetical protein SAMD00079811_15500 [Scytonema sp. HK-05]